MKHSLTKTITILPVLFAVLMIMSGCDSSGRAGDVTIDAPALSGALKFLGVCSIICSMIWGASLIAGSNRYEKGRNRERRS